LLAYMQLTELYPSKKTIAEIINFHNNLEDNLGRL